MEKVIVPAGTKQKLSEVFADLQTGIITNLRRRFNQLIGTYGISATVKNGVITSNGLLVSQTAPTTLTVQPGDALTASLNYIQTTSATNISLSATDSGLYTIVAKSAPIQDTPTTVINGFLCEPGGGTADTREHASTTFTLEASTYTTTTSGVYLADMDWNGVDTATLTDRRDENILVFKDSLLNDTNVVKKDRDSTISATLTADVISSPVANVTALTTVGRTILTYPELTTISGIENLTFKIGVGTLNGGAGVNVLTEASLPTTLINLRLYDVKPTENKNETKSYIHLKWNYDDINGTDNGGGTFLVTGLLGGGTLDESSANIVDKYFYFPETGNTYLVTAWDNTTKVATLTGYAGEVPTIPDYAVRLIDGATGYQLKVRSDSDTSGTLTEFNKTNTKYETLDTSFVYNPQFSTKLDLGVAHWIQLRSQNSTTYGGYQLMASGIYDPDHSPGGQDEQSYGQPFVNNLPYLTDDGTSTLEQRANGFNVTIGGWTNGSDIDQTAHEFEIGWSTSAVDFEDKVGTSTQVSSDRNVDVTTNASSNWNVSVRPLQNKSVVGLTKDGSVTSGVAGSEPEMSLAGEADINLVVLSGLCTAVGGSNIGHVAVVDYTTVTVTDWYDDVYGDDPPVLAANELANMNGISKRLNIDGQTWEDSRNGSIVRNEVPAPNSTIKVDSTLPADVVSPTLFNIGTAKTGRFLYQTSLNADFTIKRIVFIADSVQNVTTVNPGIIRVYQSGNEVNYGSLDINGVGTEFSGDISVEILASISNTRTVIIDAWDPDPGTPNNEASLVGHVLLYGTVPD